MVTKKGKAKPSELPLCDNCMEEHLRLVSIEFEDGEARIAHICVGCGIINWLDVEADR